MKSLVFDTGPIISFTTNNLLWLFSELKEKFKGDFYISEATKRELVDKPLLTKKFKLEALQVRKIIKQGVFDVVENEKLKKKTIELLDLANNCFFAKKHPLNIAHYAEISDIAACILLGSDVMVIDERTTRLLVEDPMHIQKILQRKLHTKVSVDKGKVEEFSSKVRKLKMIRSVELVTVAYELGLLNRYLAEDIENPKSTLLESALWGVKLNGCSVSDEEIDKIIKMES
mgnify:CR=1 FL=1